MDDTTEKIRAFVERERFTIRETAYDDPRGAIACIRLQAAWDNLWAELQAATSSSAA